MWQVDNDRYHLWRLEHELGVKQVDRLLNSITAADRLESPSVAPIFARFGRTLWGFAKRLCFLLPVAFMSRRMSQ